MMSLLSNLLPLAITCRWIGRALRSLLGLSLLLAQISCASATRGLRMGRTPSTPTTQQALRAMRGERRVALVIGNGAYTNVGSLKNPPHDADLMGRTLRSLGFSVTTVKNADVKRMQREVEQFERRLADADVGLFYFAGHGVQRDGHNYLVPTAPAIASAQDFDEHALRVAALMDGMRRAGTRMNIVILDACRNDPFPQNTRSAGAGLAEPENAAGTVVAYAAAKGRIAKDGAGDHSPYTRALTLQMRRSNVEIGTMLRNVYATVDEETDGAQQPWYEVAIKGQFYFNLGAEPPPDLDATLLEQRKNVPAIVAGSVSAGGLGAALVFGTMALHKDRKLASACGDQDPCPAKYQHLEEERNLYRSLSGVGVGVSALALGGLWWLSSDKARHQMHLRATPGVLIDSDGRALLSVGGEF